MSRARQAPHARSVFINCPYELDYLPLLATDRGLTLEELTPLERFPDWYAVAINWLAFKASGQG